MMFYVEFESGQYQGHHIKRVGCMKCNATVASKNQDGSLYYWDSKRDYKVVLSGGSIAFLPVCVECVLTITSEDLPELEKSLKFGWMKEQAWALQREPRRGAISVTRAGKLVKDIFIVSKGN